ncbi:MAG: hypothetical protein HY960_13480 [Ignavibacteriae bacterium]|nr:hypothetical protein [Ignavibacteriota bacterium]
MKTFTYFLVIVVFLTLTSAISRGQETIEGIYAIFSGDQKIETDEYEVVQGESYSDDIRSVGAKEERRVAKIIYQNSSLESYEQTLNGFPSWRASNDNKFFKLYEKEAMVGMFPVEEAIYFLDPNMYTQYWFLIQVYEQQKKEKLRLNVAVPQMQDFIYVDIERHGSDEIKSGEKAVNATHYRIGIGKKEVANCWVENGKIIGMYLATKNVYVTDASNDKLLEQLKRIVNRAM